MRIEFDIKKTKFKKFLADAFISAFYMVLFLFAFFFGLFYSAYKLVDTKAMVEFDQIIVSLWHHVWLIALFMVAGVFIFGYFRFEARTKCLVCGKKDYPSKMVVLNKRQVKTSDLPERCVCKNHKTPYTKKIPSNWKKGLLGDPKID